MKSNLKKLSSSRNERVRPFWYVYFDLQDCRFDANGIVHRVTVKTYGEGEVRFLLQLVGTPRRGGRALLHVPSLKLDISREKV